MEINLGNAKTAAQAMTTVGYNEATRSLNFRVECNDLADLKECVNIIQSYNEFDAKRVNRALEQYMKLTVDYGKGNPNNGRGLFTFDIGREGSPVLYVRMSGFTMKFANRAYSKELFEQDMKAFARAAKADEACLEDENGYEFVYRLWWD